MASYRGDSRTNILRGTSGADDFSFYIDQLGAQDQVTGGAGIDTLRLLCGGAIAASRFTGVRGIERIELFTTASNLILSDAMVASANGSRVEIVSNGSDKVNATALRAGSSIDVIALDGDDFLIGGAGDDLFTFDPRFLTAADRVQGGAGVDSLVFSASGTIAAEALVNVTQVERIVFAAGGNAITIDGSFGAEEYRLEIHGSNSDDFVDASWVQGSGFQTFSITAGGGDDILFGGNGDDRFIFAAGQLDGADQVNGFQGYDTLVFNTSGTVTAEALANVSSIETFQFAAGGNAVTLTDAVVGLEAGLTVLGSDASDIVDASRITGSARPTWFQAGAGADTFLGGASDDIATFAADELTGADRVSGGGGEDALTFTTAGVITADDLAQVTGIESFGLMDGTNNITLRGDLAPTGNARVTVGGSLGADTIDGSAATYDLYLEGDRPDIWFTGGDDVLCAGKAVSTLFGGFGSDTFVRTGLSGRTLVLDFSGDDLLGFTTDFFQTVDGEFDLMVDDTDGSANLIGADVIRYTGGTLENATEAYDYLYGSGRAEQGATGFLLATDAAGDASLYYYVDNGRGVLVSEVMEFGQTSLSTFDIADFTFF